MTFTICFLIFSGFLIMDIICYFSIKRPEILNHKKTILLFILPGPSIYCWIQSKFKKKKDVKNI